MFTHYNILDGIMPKPPTVEISHDKIAQILENNGIMSPIASIGEPLSWIMQSQRIFLEDGRCLLLKIGINSEWTDQSSILNQVRANELIRSAGIPQPKILAYSINHDDYGFLFILSESQSGTRLCEIYEEASALERVNLYKSLGKAYSQIHRVKNEWAGVWDGDPSKKKYPIHPAEFYRNAEIYNGSAKYLLDKRLISDTLMKKICTIWDDNLSYLLKRPNSLVHVSPFPWSIYTQKIQNEYTVTGVAALGDFMWWDSMYDISHLLYPPFMDIIEDERHAFISEYELDLDERAIKLYMLLNRLCAMSFCYFPPVESTYAKAWIQKEVYILDNLVKELEKH